MLRNYSAVRRRGYKGRSPRGQTVVCTLSLPTGATESNWSFSDGTNQVTPSSNPGTSWSGTAVQSGTVSVSVSGYSQPLTALLTVIPRSGWAFTAVSAQKVANGGGTGACASNLVTLTSPPPNASNVGKSCLSQAFSYSPGQVSGGPNNGYYYVASVSNSSGSNATIYQWERVPDLENTSSTFYQKQTATYNLQSDPNGCISGSNLTTQTQRHEIGSVQGHWGEYNNAQNNSSNNLGVVGELTIGAPSLTLTQFQTSVSNALTNAEQTILNASAVEPYGVNEDQNGNFLGIINWPPSYNSCQ